LGVSWSGGYLFVASPKMEIARQLLTWENS
jgi:hypothetical protein